MAKKKKEKYVVYSTNPDFDYNYDEEDEETLAPKDQLLYVSIDRKKRAGKSITLIEGFVGGEEDLKALGKLIKSKCGVGGSTKDGYTFVQGEHRDKVIQILEKEGYKTKRKGG